MPSRSFIALIVASWLATLGWYVHREIWPLLFPGDAPPFVIELADEVTSEMGGERRRPDVLWGIYRGDKRIGTAETRLRYFKEDNTFEMETRISRLKLPGLIDIEIPEMFNAYRIDRHGELRAMRMSGSMTLMGSFKGTAELSGEVRNGRLYRSGTLDLPLVSKVTPILEPIEAPRGSVLNPMHPVPRVKGLKPGQRWKMPIINPLGDAVEPALRAVIDQMQPGKRINLKLPEGPKFLDAEVLTETTTIDHNGHGYECRIIEYRGGGDLPARTYVRISDGAVLRQEANSLGDKIILQRE